MSNKTKMESQLKEELEKETKIAHDAWQKIPLGLDFDEYQEYVDEIYDYVHKLSSEYRLIQTPEMTLADKDDDVMPLDIFVGYCKSGGFIDYDGSGNYGTSTHISNITVHPSDITDGNYRKDFTHVYWYNK